MDMEKFIQVFPHPDDMHEFLVLHLQLLQWPSAPLFAYKKAQSNRLTRLRLEREKIHARTTLDLAGLGIVAQPGGTTAHRITRRQLGGKGRQNKRPTQAQE